MRRIASNLGIFVLLSLGMLAACQRNAPPKPPPLSVSQNAIQDATSSPTPPASVTSTSTSTPSATPSATPTSISTPTVTPTPTPTPAASLRLVAAHQAFAWGDYPRAQAEFTALLSDPGADLREIQAAAFWAGRSAVEAADYETALELLHEFVDIYPDNPQVPTAHLLTARAYEELGDWQGVIDGFQAYLDTGDDILAVYAYEGMGDAAMLALDFNSAVQAYADGLSAAPDNIWAVRMREEIAQAELAQGNPEEAVEQYDAILSVAHIPAYRARILYLAAQALIEADNIEAAYERYLEAVNRYPEAYDSYLALVELVNAEVPVDDYQRGLVDYHAGAYQPAIEAFTRYLEAETPTHKNEDTRWYLALSLKANGNLWQAIQEFMKFIEAHPRNEHLAEAWLEIAETYVWRDNIDQALETYRKFADETPESPLAPTALWKAAELEKESGDLEKAAASFRDLATRYPEDIGTPGALFQAALLDYRRGDFDGAQSGWAALIQDYPDSQASTAARFWLGKAWFAMEDSSEAQVAFEGARDWAPTSYYGLRAAMMLDGSSPMAAPGDTLWLANPEADQEEAEKWLASWLPITTTLALASLDPAISGNAAFRRGDALLAAGRRAEALDEFDTIKETWWDDPVALYQLSLAFRERGLHRLSIITAERLTWLSPAGGRAEVPDFIQHLSFPLYYQELILSEAQSQGVDPLLLFALIRQESLFEPSVSSPADARGLTQIIPATGEWIAGRLDWEGFDENDLNLPYVNIHFGTFYLSVQLATFDEEPILALAAYNAGPGRIHRWLEDAPDVDLFMETMPFTEPRRYVLNVFENYAHYYRLYLDKP